MHGPMDDLRVLDLTRLLPGGLATQLLADLGAEVIKVEEPNAGDYMRVAPPTLEGESYSFMLINQGKKSVALNLKDRKGQEILHRLVPTADVIIEQFRPGVAEKLGIGYGQARSLREDIVFCSLSGFGATGPYRDRPGHDLNFQALAGLIDMSTTTHDPTLPPMPIADITSGILAAYAVLAALLRRERTGMGSYLDIAINDVVAHMNLMNLAEVFAGHDPHQADTFITGSLPFYNIYETADGRHVTLAAIEEKFWQRFCEIVGKEELKEKHFIIDGDGNVREELREIFASKTLSEWEELLRDEDVPYAPVLSVREAVEDPHLRAREMFTQLSLARGMFTALNHPAKWSPQGAIRDGGPPELGEHTAEILSQVGLTPSQLGDLEKLGVVRLP